MLLPLLFLQFDDNYEWEARSGGFGDADGIQNVVFSRADYESRLKKLEKPVAAAIKKAAKRKKKDDAENALRDELLKQDITFNADYLLYLEYLRDKALEESIRKELLRIERERQIDDELALLVLL